MVTFAMRGVFLILIMFIIQVNCSAQDSIPKDKIKTGWSFGGLPIIAYNTDNGLQYGVLASVFNYGDGSKYPNYIYATRAEWSRTTKGCKTNQIFFDSKHLLPYNLRFSADISLISYTMQQFYGLNGYNAVYNSSYENPQSIEYRSKAYYRYDRVAKRAFFDFQGKTTIPSIRWVAGIGFSKIDIKPVDINKLNADLSQSEQLPNIPTLYDKYIQYGIIAQSEAKGGLTNFIKAGLVYDTRDNEPYPMAGFWTEAIFMTIPGFLGNTNTFGQVAGIFRHYYTFNKPKITIASRLAYQGVVYGNKPFYIQPYFFSTTKTSEAFGGVKTVRGVMNARLQGDGIAFGNVELRYKTFRKIIFNQNFCVALTAFTDAGLVVQNHKISETALQQFIEIKQEQDKLHLGYGMGAHLIMNQNFNISIDYGKAASANDGEDGLYIDLDFLF